MIIVLHRALAIPYGTESSEGPPRIPINGKWKPMHREHSLAVLYGRVVELLRDNADELNKRCQTDWLSIPKDLDEAIAMIDRADPSSTFFRYTDRRTPEADHEKSSWKERKPSDIFSQMGPGHEPVKAFLLIGSDDNIRNAYQYEQSTMTELSKTLCDTAKTLSGAQAGLRVELAGGF